MGRVMFPVIYEELRDEIQCGSLPHGSFLPPEQELCQRFDCSRMTVRKAISLLANEGLVQPIKGHGVRVLWNSDHTLTKKDAFTVSGLTSFTESARDIGAEPSARLILLDHVTCTEGLSSRTGFPQGADLTRVGLVRALDNVPIVVSHHFFLTSEAPGITEEVATHSIFRYLEDELHISITVSRRQVTMAKATPEDCELLGVSDTWVAVLTSATFDNKGEQFEYVENHYLPEYFHFNDTATRTPLP